MRKYVVAVYIFCVPFCSSVAMANDYDAIEILIKKDIQEANLLQKRWASVESELISVSTNYRRATNNARACKSGVWQTFFSKTYNELEASRKKLEESRKNIEIANKAANTSFRGSLKKLAVLEAEYKKKTKDSKYYEKKSDFSTLISSEYTDVLNANIIPSYNNYFDAINELSDAYNAVSKGCKSLFPFQTILETTLQEVLGKISIVNALTSAILKKVPSAAVSKQS